MSASEWAAVGGAAACAVALVALLVVLARLRRAARDLRETVAEFRRHALPALVELRHAVRAADFELDRVDALVSGAEAVQERVDSASRLAYRTFASPVVKVLAAGTGTRRALARLTGEPSPRVRSGSNGGRRRDRRDGRG